MFFEKTRDLAIGIWAIVMSFLAPVEMAIIVLFVFAIVDVLAGAVGNRVSKHEEFKFNKAFNAIVKMCFFMCFVILMHFLFYLFDEIEIAKVVTKYLSWIIAYWYIVNILSNALKIFPSSKAIKFLLDLFEMQVLKILENWVGVDISSARLESKERRENEKDTEGDKEQ